MKLSMWMLLNRLEYLEPEVHIREETPRILRSAHRAYATNCVHVYPASDGRIICEGAGDRLILRDIDPLEALDVIQYVFDFYNDWNTSVRSLLNRGEYQKVVEQAWNVFHNPVLLFDANFRLLGISDGGGENASSGDDLTAKFREEVQHDSLDMMNRSIREYIDRQAWNNFLDEAPTIYHTIGENGQEHTGALCNIFYSNYLVGRLFILERNRKLNPGDLQSMEVLARLIRLSMEKTFQQDGAHPFYRMLEGGTISEEALDNLLDFYQWKRDDTFRVFAISFPENFERKREIAALVRGQLTVLYPDSCLLDYDNETVGIIRAPLVRDYTAYEALETTLHGSGLIVGTSIENRGIDPLAELLRQAHYACDYARRNGAKTVVTRFFHCAVEALLFSDWSVESKRAACHPGVARLRLEGKKGNPVLYDTLTAYIHEERSVSATAKRLFVHKNTLLYRLNQIYAYIPKAEFDAPYCRDYIRLSIHYLNGSVTN